MTEPMPGARFLFAHPAHLIACGLGSGLSPFAPGTAGTLLAWLLFAPLKSQFSDTGFLLALAAAFALGVAACHTAGKSLGVADHGSIVWDEMVPFWLVLTLTPSQFGWQAGAFALFRAFDIAKPPPAAWIDAHMKNGLGVMLDDLAAAFYTLLALAVLKRLVG
jgi:phosphatidylglycerophosphatase A